MTGLQGRKGKKLFVDLSKLCIYIFAYVSGLFLCQTCSNIVTYFPPWAHNAVPGPWWTDKVSDPPWQVSVSDCYPR